MQLKAATNILLMYAVTSGVDDLCKLIDDDRTVRVTLMPLSDGGDGHAFHLALPNGDERVVALAFGENKITAEGEYVYPNLTFGDMVVDEVRVVWWDVWKQPQLITDMDSVQRAVDYLAPIIVDYLVDNWLPAEAISLDDLEPEPETY